ncbi:MAG: ribonuclease P protein component [Candidatus Falkowbacteria bacterium]
MLKRENRLTKNNDFDAVFKKGRSCYSKILSVKYLPNSLEENRFGILVGTKISKKAVIRNKIKRQIRAAIESELFLLNKGNDCVIVVFPLILANNFDEIKSALNFCFKKTGLYKKV